MVIVKFFLLFLLIVICKSESGSGSESGSAIDTTIIRNLTYDVHTYHLSWLAPIDYPNTIYQVQAFVLETDKLYYNETVNRLFQTLQIPFLYRTYNISVIPKDGRSDSIIYIDKIQPSLISAYDGLNDTYWVPSTFNKYIQIIVNIIDRDQYEWIVNDISISQSSNNFTQCIQSNQPYCTRIVRDFIPYFRTYELYLSSGEISCNFWSLTRRNETLKSCPILNIYKRKVIPKITSLKYQNGILSWGRPIGTLPNVNFRYSINLYGNTSRRFEIYPQSFNLTRQNIPCQTYNVTVSALYDGTFSQIEYINDITPICGDWKTNNFPISSSKTIYSFII